MKRILLSICIGTLALGVTAWGAQQEQLYQGPGKKAQRATAVQKTTSATPRSYSRSVNTANRVNTPRSISATSYHPRTNNVARLNSSNAVIHRDNVRRARIQASQNFSANNARLRARNNVTVNREFNPSRD